MKAGWQKKTLGDVCQVEKTQGLHKGLPYVGLENIESKTARFIGSTEPSLVKSSTFKFSNKHILYGRLRPYLNKVLAPDFAGHCSTEIFPIAPGPQLSRYYLLYWLMADETVDRINATCTGARMPRADMNEVLEFDFPLAPLSEQQRIVAILDEAFDCIATARANTEKNLQNARALFESHLQSILTQRSNDWIEAPLEACFKLRSGENLTSKMMNENGAYPVYGGNGIAGRHDDFNLTEGNVIIGRVGALCGNARHIEEKVWITDNAFKVVEMQYDFDLAFLTCLLNFKSLRAYARQAAQPVISNSSLKGVLLRFPKKISDQELIVNEIERLKIETQRLESLYQRKLAALDELKKSLLHKAFSGEL